MNANGIIVAMLSAYLQVELVRLIYYEFAVKVGIRKRELAAEGVSRGKVHPEGKLKRHFGFDKLYTICGLFLFLFLICFNNVPLIQLC